MDDIVFNAGILWSSSRPVWYNPTTLTFSGMLKSKYTRHWYISTLTRGAEQLIIFRCLNSEKLSGYLSKSVEVPFSGEQTEHNEWRERRKNCIDSCDTHPPPTACRTSVLTMEMLYFEHSIKCNSCGGHDKTQSEYLKFTSTPEWFIPLSTGENQRCQIWL